MNACRICQCIDSAPRADPARCRHCQPDLALWAALGAALFEPGIDLSGAVDTARFPAITWSVARAEIERELDQRRRSWPDRAAAGRMPKEEAEHGIAIFAAIAGDIDRMAHIGPPPVPPRPHGFSWNDRRAALSREIEQREHFYPDRVANGRLTQERADRQIATLRAILWRYDSGFDWRPTNRTWAQSAQEMLDGKPESREQRETRAEMDAIWRPYTGFFYQRWPNADAPAAEPQLAL